MQLAWLHSWLLHAMVCAACIAFHGAGFSQTQTTILRLDAAPDLKNTSAAPLDIAVGLSANLTVQDIAALPRERFTAFNSGATYPIARDKPLWLRLQIDSGAAIASDWQIEMPSVVVDRYEVYHRDAAGAWQMQTAGDAVAHASWPVNSLRPRFPLGASAVAGAQGQQDVFIRVVHLMPSRITPEIVHAQTAAQRDLHQMLLMGALLGLFGVLILVCLQMAVAYRDWTYLWYAGYLLFTMLTAVAYSGLGQYFLWPQASKFASDALVCFELTAFAFNLQFVNAMFGKRIGASHRWITLMLVGTCIAYAAYISMAAQYADTVMLFMGIVIASCIFIVGTAVVAWRKNVPYSGYWLLIYGPYLSSIALASLENAGQISMPWLPVNLPLITIMFEAMAMMFCLNAFSREGHAQAVREQAAAQRDPLTGFLNETHFLQAARQAWQRASSARRDITLAYVLVDSTDRSLSTIQIEELLLRSVRMVRIAMRESDELGRIGPNMLGIFMPNTEPGDALDGRLARLITLGQAPSTPGSSGSTAHVLQFTLAVATRRITAQNFEVINQRLREMLLQGSDSSDGNIRYLKPLA